MQAVGFARDGHQPLFREAASHISYLVVVLGEGHEGPRLVCLSVLRLLWLGRAWLCWSFYTRSGWW